MDTPYSKPGKVTIAPEVLLTIARLSALSVPGVAHMSAVPGGVNRLFQRGIGDGVRIEVKDNAVAVELYLVVHSETNLRDIGLAVQEQVNRAIQDMVGMNVIKVDIHIEDVAHKPAVPAVSAA